MSKDPSQPFPSPGSSFIPPPVPGPHEFAIPRKMSRIDADTRPPNLPNGAVSHTSTLSILRSFVPRFIVSILNLPRSLWRVLQFQDPAPSSTSSHHHVYDTAPPPDHPLLPSSHNRLSIQSTTSLTSSRPAPPSPAISRRASRLSRTSSRQISGLSSRTSSRPVSSADPRTSSRTPQPSTGSTPASPSLPRQPHDRPTALTPTPAVDPEPVPTPTPTQATLATTTTPLLIYIRDYAFAQTDPRFQGHGQHVPRPNRPTILARRLAPSSELTSIASSNGDQGDADDDDADYEDVDDDDDGCADDYDCDDPDDEENEVGGQARARSHYGVFSRVWEEVVDDGTNGWGGLKWGFDRVWAFGRTTTNTTSTNTTGGAGGFPSRGDLDRNFGAEDDEDSMDVDQEAETEAYSDDMDDDLDITTDSEMPLLPGLYRAMYAFEPEGTAEMRLEEDQLVRVIGRGGGVGWAVVVKDGLKDAGVHALVPESYLEPARLDGEDKDG